MQIKTLAVSALAAVMIAGCGTSAKEEPAKAAAKAEQAPALLTGASAEMLASTCEGCHGDNGVSNGPATPSIAGMSAYYFAEAMAEFAEEDTVTTIMTRIAKGYSEEEIRAMAEYFAKQKPESAKQETQTVLAMKGANLHEEYCSECHKDGGKDISEDAGLLAGQWMPYLRNTLADYRSGDRLGGRKMLKKIDEMVDAHGEQSIEAVVNYYGGQRL